MFELMDTYGEQAVIKVIGVGGGGEVGVGPGPKNDAVSDDVCDCVQAIVWLAHSGPSP